MSVTNNDLKAKSLIINNIADVEASITLLQNIDIEVLTIITERMNNLLGGKKHGWLGDLNADDFTSSTSWIAPQEWASKEDEDEAVCYFELNTGDDEGYDYNSTDVSKSLVARLTKARGSSGDFGVWWFLESSPVSDAKQKKYFIETHGLVTIETEFQYISSQPGFFIPFALEQEKLVAAFESNMVASFIEAETDGYIAKIIAAVPHLTAMVRQIEKLSGERILKGKK